MRIAYVVTHLEVELTDEVRDTIEEGIRRVAPDAAGFIRLRNRYAPRDTAYVLTEERQALDAAFAEPGVAR